MLPSHQGRGLGAELVGALTGWAMGHAEVEIVFAETLPELKASQRVLEKNGFVRVPNVSEPGVIRFERRRG